MDTDDKENLKMKWVKPELKELNLAGTKSGDIYPDEIATTAGPS